MEHHTGAYVGFVEEQESGSFALTLIDDDGQFTSPVSATNPHDLIAFAEAQHIELAPVFATAGAQQ